MNPIPPRVHIKVAMRCPHTESIAVATIGISKLQLVVSLLLKLQSERDSTSEYFGLIVTSSNVSAVSILNSFMF